MKKARTGTNACGKREEKPKNDPSLEDKKQKFQAIGLTATDRERDGSTALLCACCLSLIRTSRAEHVMVVVAQHKQLIK